MHTATRQSEDTVCARIWASLLSTQVQFELFSKYQFVLVLCMKKPIQITDKYTSMQVTLLSVNITSQFTCRLKLLVIKKKRPNCESHGYHTALSSIRFKSKSYVTPKRWLVTTRLHDVIQLKVTI
jgi:hypothetical protein